MNGAAESIFEQITSEEQILAFANDFEGEKLHLDFKTGHAEHLTTRFDDFKDMLSKALSGFANSDGGVVVFGVREIRGTPSTFELSPYTNPGAVRQKCLELVSRLTSPPVPGVQVKQIAASANADHGFVVILIPRSDSAPHQHSQKHLYYRRAGESHSPMQHFEIADAFGRRPQPDLRPIIEFHRDPNRRDAVAFKLMLGNKGGGVAKFPIIWIESFTIVEGEQNFTPWMMLDPLHRNPRVRVFSGYGDKVIHSGLRYPIWGYYLPRSYVEEIIKTGNTPKVRCTVGAEGMETKQFEIEISVSALLQYQRGGELPASLVGVQPTGRIPIVP